MSSDPELLGSQLVPTADPCRVREWPSGPPTIPTGYEPKNVDDQKTKDENVAFHILMEQDQSRKSRRVDKDDQVEILTPRASSTAASSSSAMQPTTPREAEGSVKRKPPESPPPPTPPQVRTSPVSPQTLGKLRGQRDQLALQIAQVDAKYSIFREEMTNEYNLAKQEQDAYYAFPG